MIVSGVSTARAKLMYAAVYFAGSRWSPQAVHNNQIKQEKESGFVIGGSDLHDVSIYEELLRHAGVSPAASSKATATETPDTTGGKFNKAVRKTVDVTGGSLDEETGLRSGPSPTPGSKAELHLALLQQVLLRYDPSPEDIASALDQATNLTDPILQNRSIMTGTTPSGLFSE